MNDALSELDERAVALVNEYRDGSQFAILIRTKDGDNNAVNTICPNVDLDAIARFLHQVADNPSVKSTVDAALVKARLN